MVEVDLRACHRPLHQIGQAGDKGWIDIQGRHPPEVGDASFVGQLAVFDIDFLEGFDVLAHKADRHHHQFLHPLGTQLGQGLFGVGLEPLDRPHAALVGQG